MWRTKSIPGALLGDGKNIRHLINIDLKHYKNSSSPNFPSSGEPLGGRDVFLYLFVPGFIKDLKIVRY